MIKKYDPPIIYQRADPQIIYDGNERYYFIATVPEFDRIELRSAPSIEALADACPKTVWTKSETDSTSKYIWAPEMHKVFGKWVIYFAATGNEPDENGVFDHRIYALICDGENPFEGKYTEPIQIKTGMESFSLDATVYSGRGKNYFIWAQRDYSIPGNSNIYISEMKSPYELAGNPVLLSKPEYEWECNGFMVNEGPAVLEHNGRLYLTYSGSATDERYAVGMLEANVNSNLLNAGSWHKSICPVMKTDASHKLYGPGHNNFFKDKNGKDYIVFHARSYAGFADKTLSDPNRNTFVWPVEYDSLDRPIFD